LDASDSDARRVAGVLVASRAVVAVARARRDGADARARSARAFGTRVDGARDGGGYRGDVGDVA